MRGAKSVDADPGVGVVATVDLVEGVRPPTPWNGVRWIELSDRSFTGVRFVLFGREAVRWLLGSVAAGRVHGSGEYARLERVGQRSACTSVRIFID